MHAVYRSNAMLKVLARDAFETLVKLVNSMKQTVDDITALIVNITNVEQV